MAGLDLEMSGSSGFNDAKIIAVVKDGSLDETLFDNEVERILKVIFSYVDHRHPEAVFDREAEAVGQLLKHPITAPVVGEMMKSIQEAESVQVVDAETAADVPGTDTEMIETLNQMLGVKN